MLLFKVICHLIHRITQYVEVYSWQVLPCYMVLRREW